MTTSRRTPSMLFGIAFLMLGVYVSVQAFSWKVYAHDGPGPGFFPLVYGGAMALLGFLLAAREVITPTASSEDGEPTNPVLAVATLAALALSVPLMSILGFVVGFGITLFLLIRFIFGEPLLKSAIIATAIVTVLHVGFVMLLQASLPAGKFWGF